MSIHERIKKIRVDAGDSQDAFAKKIGLTHSAVSLYENGNRAVTEPTIKLICSAYNVSYDWLKTGNGEPYIENDDIDSLISTLLADEDSSVREVFRACAKSLNEKDWNDILRIIKKISKNI